MFQPSERTVHHPDIIRYSRLRLSRDDFRPLGTRGPKQVCPTPLATQIEAPDPDDKNPFLSVHPGVVAYLNSGEQSFFDEFQKYFYLGGMVLSMAGSAIALLVMEPSSAGQGKWRRQFERRTPNCRSDNPAQRCPSRDDG
jgi:hypothetical protein